MNELDDPHSDEEDLRRFELGDLRSSNEDLRRFAIMEASRTKDSSCLPRLFILLETDTYANRRHVVRALGNIGGEASERRLHLLKSEDGLILGDIALTLGKLTSRAALPRLRELLANPTEWVAQKLVQHYERSVWVTQHTNGKIGNSSHENLKDPAEAMVNLERMVAAVKGQEAQESKFATALKTLKALSRKEGIPLAIVGGLAAIHHGYERFTKDIDVVVRSGNLDVLTRVAPQYGIKVIWIDPDGWHKLQCEGVAIDVVPEGRKARKDAPTVIPGPEQLGVREGASYAGIAGWMETKLGSYRVQDRADVVQVIKVTTSATLRRIRKHMGKAHAIYLQRFDELLGAAKEEKEQERERGGAK